MGGEDYPLNGSLIRQTVFRLADNQLLRQIQNTYAQETPGLPQGVTFVYLADAHV